MKSKIKYIFLILLIIVLAFIIFLLVFGEQSKTYSPSLSCEELRDCVLLEINCLDKYVENNFLGFEWSFETKIFLIEQKGYYQNNCMEILK